MHAQSTGHVELIGHIWQPGIGPCAQRIEIRAYDVENIGEAIDRDSILDWVYLNAGDFQTIEDFSAVIGDVEIPWADEDNECVYLDCMFPSDDVDAVDICAAQRPCACGDCTDCA